MNKRFFGGCQILERGEFEKSRTLKFNTSFFVANGISALNEKVGGAE